MRVIPTFLPSSAGVIDSGRGGRTQSEISTLRFQWPRLIPHRLVPLGDIRKRRKITGDTCPSGTSPKGSGFLDEPHGPASKTPLTRRGVFVRKRELGLDLHEDTGRDDEAVERFDGAGGGLEDVDHTLVRAPLELLARLLVDMRAAEHRVALDAGRDRDRTAHAGVGPLGVIDNFLRRRIQRPVVVGFHPNSNPIASHIVLFPVTRGGLKNAYNVALSGTGKSSQFFPGVKGRLIEFTSEHSRLGSFLRWICRRGSLAPGTTYSGAKS